MVTRMRAILRAVMVPLAFAIATCYGDPTLPSKKATEEKYERLRWGINRAPEIAITIPVHEIGKCLNIESETRINLNNNSLDSMEVRLVWNF